MKCKHPNTYEKLGFDQVLEDLLSYVLHPEAKERLMEIKPISNYDRLILELKKVEEFVALEELDESFPSGGQVRIKPMLDKLEVKGNWLSLDEVWRLHGWLGHSH